MHAVAAGESSLWAGTLKVKVKSSLNEWLPLRTRCKVIYSAGKGRLGERVACRASSPRRKGVLFASWPSAHHPRCLFTFELRLQSSKINHLRWLNIMFAI